MKTKKELKQVRDYFDIIDALRGSVTGNFQAQLKKLEKGGMTCSQELYYEAYQCSEQM